MSLSVTPEVTGIDHIHIYVADRSQAEKWYADVLGYKRVAALEAWATQSGPLTLTNAEENAHLALFQRYNPLPSNVLAFGSVGSEFIRWQSHLRSLGARVQIKDHDLSISMYFEDPGRNVLEITTYDHVMVREELHL